MLIDDLIFIMAFRKPELVLTELCVRDVVEILLENSGCSCGSDEHNGWKKQWVDIMLIDRRCLVYYD